MDEREIGEIKKSLFFEINTSMIQNPIKPYNPMYRGVDSNHAVPHPFRGLHLRNKEPTSKVQKSSPSFLFAFKIRAPER